MKNIFEELRKDHETQRDLLDAIVDTSGKTDARKRMYKALKDELTRHAKYEEQNFYAPLMKMDMTQELARHSVAEHKDIDDLIEKIDDLDLDSPTWLKYVKDLDHLVKHHLDEEEREVFPVAGRALNQTEKRELGKDYSQNMQA